LDGRCLRAVRARLRAVSPREERGAVLVEIMVSAVILVVVAGATFKSIDAASSVSSKSKSKGVATSIAQKSMDDLRTTAPKQLSSWGSKSTTETVDGVVYSIATSAYWVRDSTQDKSCDGNPGDYLRLSASVTWQGMTASDKPVKVYSIVTEPNGTYEKYGNLAIKILNASGAGVPNISVNLTSPTVLSDTADVNGCAYFANVNPGTYAGSFSKTSYVDKDGTNVINGSWTIVAGQTTVQTFGYDLQATPTVNFKLGDPTTGSATTGQYATFYHVQRAATLEAGSAAGVNSVSATGLYPFTSAYAVYSGRATCAGNDTVTTAATLTPGSSPTINVSEPPLNIQVQKNGVNIANGTTTASWKATHSTQTSCLDTALKATTATGTIAAADNGFPAAQYSVCVRFTGYTPAATRTLSKPVSTLNLAAGSALVTFNFTSNAVSGAPTNGSSTACP
jgi:hypothetical protein